jgi:hypothetical protein
VLHKNEAVALLYMCDEVLDKCSQGVFKTVVWGCSESAQHELANSTKRWPSGPTSTHLAPSSAGLGWAWLDLGGLGLAWLGSTGLGWVWLDSAGLGWAWLGLAGIGWTWLGLTGLGWAELSLVGLGRLGSAGLWLCLIGLGWPLAGLGFGWAWVSLVLKSWGEGGKRSES